MLNILRPKQDECFLSSSLSNKYFKMRSFSPTNLYRLSVLQSVVHTNSMIFSCYHWSKGYEMRVNWVFRNTGCLGKNVFFFSNPLQPIPCLHIAVSSHSLLLAGHFRTTNIVVECWRGRGCKRMDILGKQDTGFQKLYYNYC